MHQLELSEYELVCILAALHGSIGEPLEASSFIDGCAYRTMKIHLISKLRQIYEFGESKGCQRCGRPDCSGVGLGHLNGEQRVEQVEAVWKAQF